MNFASQVTSQKEKSIEVPLTIKHFWTTSNRIRSAIMRKQQEMRASVELSSEEIYQKISSDVVERVLL
jgi:hypothetical protein